MKCEQFCNYHCCTSDCPNIQYEACDAKWGDGIADDVGMERVECKDCVYADQHCGCDDCYFHGSKECSENGCNEGGAEQWISS